MLPSELSGTLRNRLESLDREINTFECLLLVLGWGPRRNDDENHAPGAPNRLVVLGIGGVDFAPYGSHRVTQCGGLRPL